MAEAGYFPGVIWYFTLWYVRKDQAFRMSIFFSAGILAGAFGGILAYGIGQLDNKGGLTAWQWLFLLEGAPTVCLAILTFFFLADFPARAKWLNQCEKDLLADRLLRDADVIVDDGGDMSWEQIKSAFLDWQVLFYMLIYFSTVTPAYSLKFFLPTIINDMGYSVVNTQLLTIPPYVVSCL
ncbi:unnamed protein product, partial [Didymodactylos carnosus]